MNAVAAGFIEAETSDAAPLLAFMLVMIFALLLALMFGANADGRDEIYLANRSIGPWKNALALTGDATSVLTVLTVTGLVSLAGYDGAAVAVSMTCGLGLLLIMAARLNETGDYTLGGTLGARFPGRSIRIAASIATLCACLPLAMVQLTAAGGVTAALVGISGGGAVQICTALIGILMIIASVFSGMRGNTSLQAIKCVVLLSAMLVLAWLLMREMNWSIDRVVTEARQNSANPDHFYDPGAIPDYNQGRLDVLSVHFTIIFGTAAMPHLIMRTKSSPLGRTAQRAVARAIVLFTIFSLIAVLIGLGSAALTSGPSVHQTDPGGSMALLRLGEYLDSGSSGGLLQAMLVSAVFLTSLTVVTALTFCCGVTVAHDLYKHVWKRGQAEPASEVTMMRWATPTLGVAIVIFAIISQSWDVRFLAQLTGTIAGASIFPALVYALFWKKATRSSILWSVYGGLGSSLILQFFGRTVSGTPSALFPSADFAWFPLTTTAVVSVPIGFLCGWLGSRFSTPNQMPQTLTTDYHIRS
ncbi:sodium/solute symporter [Streptomyces sp. NPDC003832]